MGKKQNYYSIHLGTLLENNVLVRKQMITLFNLNELFSIIIYVPIVLTY